MINRGQHLADNCIGAEKMYMSDPPTRRPFQERFLDGFDRAQLRREVQKVKPRRVGGLRKRYATWALGASLALGGLAVPLRIVHDAQSKPGKLGRRSHPPSHNKHSEALDAAGITPEIARDLRTAHEIATAVTGGALTAASSPLQTISRAPQTIVQVVAAAPKSVLTTAEAVREHFFQTQVPFGSIIYREALKNDLPPELVAAIVQSESRYVPTARSQVGAIGLMQLIPQTGRWMGARDLTNPGQNIAAGAKYLRYLNDRFQGDEQKTIAAFNAGEGNVRRFGGVPPFRETRNYLARVEAVRNDLNDQVSSHALDLGVGQ
jgi:soluble lytic murein transglycosylase-like protein